jgi:hypothetical protein
MCNLMKVLMLGASLIMPFVASAHTFPWSTSSITCGQALVYLGDIGRNPVVKTNVGYDHNTGTWTVLHTLRNGTVVDRSIQYLRSTELAATKLSGQAVSWHNLGP